MEYNPANHHCYDVIESKMSFDDAVMFCQDLYPGGHPVDYQDAFEETFVRQIVEFRGTITLFSQLSPHFANPHLFLLFTRYT